MTFKRKRGLPGKTIKDALGGELVLKSLVANGADGIVYRASYKGQDKAHPGPDLAVKFFVPLKGSTLFSNPASHVQFVKQSKRRLENEIKQLRAIDHPNILRFYSYGEFEYDDDYFDEFAPMVLVGESVPFIVTRFIEGKRLDELLREPTLVSPSEVLSHLRSVAAGLAHIHDHDLTHADVRCSNVIVEGKSNRPILIDFALSKSFGEPLGGPTQFFYDPRRIPPKITHFLDQYVVQHECDRPTLQRLVHPMMDLFLYGCMLTDVLASPAGAELNGFTRGGLQILATELVRWEVGPGPSDDLLTHTDGFLREAAQVVAHLEKLCSGPVYYQQVLARNTRNPARRVVRLGGYVDVHDSIAPLLAHPFLRRLQNLNQLALIHYVYPSAGQTRFDHLLSALARSQQVWAALSHSAKFILVMGAQDIQRLELSALVHDINHFPFLHYFQEAGVPELEREHLLTHIVETSRKFEDPSAGFDFWGCLSDRGITLDYLRSLLSDEHPVESSAPNQLIKSIVNSGVDVDKLAYLRDDAVATGVPFGNGVDVQGLLANIDVDLIETDVGKVWHIVFDEDALPAIESLSFARYWNFQRVYWHHVNRALASMIIRTIRDLYQKPANTLVQYLEATWNVGDSGALDFLERRYLETFARPAPIAGLSTNRDKVYRRVCEISFTQFPDVLHALQDPDLGPARRLEAGQRVHDVVAAFAKRHDYGADVADQQVLLDIPLRKMGLGGSIFIRGFDGRIKPAAEISDPLKTLTSQFQVMGKILRVFVAPAVRDAIGRSVWEREAVGLRKDVLRAITGKRNLSEVS